MRDIKFRVWSKDKSLGYKMHGYQYRKAAYHPNANSRGYVLEHKLIMENQIGEYLPKSAVVHHKNHLRADNRIENLRLLTRQGNMQAYFRLIGKRGTIIKVKSGKYRARIDNVSLYTWDTEDDAKQAIRMYDEAIKKYDYEHFKI